MKVIETVSAFKSLRQEWRAQKLTLGFVPTMGALHQGHLSLLERARKENARSAVSLFVNPTQFNDPKDFEKYPQPRERDLMLLERAGVSAVFVPAPQEIYHDGYRFTVTESMLSALLCGPGRPGHFNGVLTVVLKLLNIAGAEHAYFGEKDFQQLKMIQDMAAAFFLDTKIVACPTVRERDGLAMSSRNLRLTPEQRQLAPQLFRVLTEASTPDEAAQQMNAAGFKVEYVEEHWGCRFVAATLGEVRLIDNVAR